MALAGCSRRQETEPAPTATARPASPTEAELKNLVERGFAYVASTNILGGFALNDKNPYYTGGWNEVSKPKGLADHTARSVAGPNNDTLYVPALLDLRAEPVIVSFPAFSSDFVSLETGALDHYIDIPLATNKGDFREPTDILFYTSTSADGYAGEPVEGVERIQEMTGDFATAFTRVMPHAAEPERFEKIMAEIEQVKVRTLSEFRGEAPKPVAPTGYPPFGPEKPLFTDHFLEIMQFAFNHTRFDPDDELDQALQLAFAKVGVVPGREFDPDDVAEIDAEMMSKVYGEVQDWSYAHRNDYILDMFRSKGEMTKESMLAGVVTGPYGQPATQAIYPLVETADGQVMNAQHDYVLRMTADQVPPAKAFWSFTLYDRAEGFFIPNDRHKYSVGKNGGMKLRGDGGIDIHIAAEKPEGVPEENWLPIQREDLDLSLRLRIYDPDLERFENWSAPKVERVD